MFNYQKDKNTKKVDWKLDPLSENPNFYTVYFTSGNGVIEKHILAGNSILDVAKRSPVQAVVSTIYEPEDVTILCIHSTSIEDLPEEYKEKYKDTNLINININY